MLTKITLENFKGYRTPTTIPLALTTLHRAGHPPQQGRGKFSWSGPVDVHVES